ncbi:MAG TPA: helix-turn-helix domain-containing protein, partial [Anaerolineales bacterium]|nr:helix-turn-helix domain-containing protein [Anaerolineales bacterium]
ADALRDAAQNPSGGAGLTAGIGAGIGVGNVIGESLRGMTGGAAAGGAPSGSAPQGTPPAGGMPDVMTPAEAATFLKVSEEDILAAIQAGDLKARKLGNAFRISRESLEAFLKG